MHRHARSPPREIALNETWGVIDLSQGWPRDCRSCFMRMPDLGRLAQQMPYESDAFAASRFLAKSVIHHRYSAALAIGVGAKIAIGDPVAETDVHSHGNPKLTAFICQSCEQFAISLAAVSTCRVELPHHRSSSDESRTALRRPPLRPSS